nr:MAG TPA: hypothetical protein [Caudoviricetes sp.]DAS85895.1 MAG TPA: hypothetical protein [Caudoviricetes sp.]
MREFLKPEGLASPGKYKFFIKFHNYVVSEQGV